MFKAGMNCAFVVLAALLAALAATPRIVPTLQLRAPRSTGVLWPLTVE